MSSPTPEQRAEWREHVAEGSWPNDGTYPDDALVVVLDALEAIEHERAALVAVLREALGPIPPDEHDPIQLAKMLGDHGQACAYKASLAELVAGLRELVDHPSEFYTPALRTLAVEVTALRTLLDRHVPRGES